MSTSNDASRECTGVQNLPYLNVPGGSPTGAAYLGPLRAAPPAVSSTGSTQAIRPEDTAVIQLGVVSPGLHSHVLATANHDTSTNVQPSLQRRRSGL